MDLFAFNEDFFKGIPYKPEAFFIDRLLSADSARRQIVCEVDTRKTFPLVEGQRHHELLHPPHLPGAIIIHLTGMVGLAAAWYFLGVRFDRGWSGYGSRIHRAEFKRLVRLGPALSLECGITEVKSRGSRMIVRYSLRFSQEGFLAYAGEQTAFYRQYALPLE